MDAVADQLPPAEAEPELGLVLRDFVSVTQRLQATHETLQREVERLRDELEHKNRELERSQRLAALGELAAGVAHEVRNPLGAIQLYSGLLRSECGRLEPALKLIEKIDNGIRAIEGVVADTLSLAPRGGQLQPRGVRGLIDQARDFCQPVLARHRVRCETRLADPGLTVLADEQAIQRVLINLISNAAEACPPETTVLIESGAKDAQIVRIQVVDQGPGVPKELLDRIFDPFFTTKARGTGLGLAIAHRLVEAHGGRMGVRNRPEGGAEFTIELPGGAGATPRQTYEEAGQSNAA